MTYRGGEARATLLERCRSLRRSATDAEQLLWRLLRARQVAGAKLRRQHQFGQYIVDFYCHERRLAIEVDGDHAAQASADAARTRSLEAHGLRVMRFSSRAALTETEAVLEAIWDAVETLTSTLSQGGRDPEY